MTRTRSVGRPLNRNGKQPNLPPATSNTTNELYPVFGSTLNDTVAPGFSVQRSPVLEQPFDLQDATIMTLCRSSRTRTDTGSLKVLHPLIAQTATSPTSPTGATRTRSLATSQGWPTRRLGGRSGTAC